MIGTTNSKVRVDEKASAQRPDTLADQARRRLESEACFRGRSHLIRIEEKEGTLFLSGRLPSFYLKQLLQTTLRGLEGVKEIENSVDVD